MGCGVMPDGSFNQACVFEHIQIVNADYQMVDIDPSKVHDFYHGEKQCYKLRYFGDLGPETLGKPSSYRRTWWTCMS